MKRLILPFFLFLIIFGCTTMMKSEDFCKDQNMSYSADNPTILAKQYCNGNQVVCSDDGNCFFVNDKDSEVKKENE